MTQKWMIGMLNTSAVMGLGIAIISVLLFLNRKKYSARCRKGIWIFMAVLFLTPFSHFRFSGAYSLEIPNVVLREFEHQAIYNRFTLREDPIIMNEEGSAGETDGAGMDGQSQTVWDEASQLSLKPAEKTSLTVADVLFAVWIIVAVALAVYFAEGYRRMRGKIRRWSSECEEKRVQEVFSELVAECGLKKIPEVRIMRDSSAGPFTTGVLKNMIILPDENLQEKDLRFILKHELTHCKNKDILWRLLFLIVNVIYWFHPLAWYLRKTAEQEMEIACDEAVVFNASKADRKEYSDVIMSWVEQSRYQGSVISTGYVRGAKFLKRRFDSIFGSGGKKNGTFLACGAFALVLLIGCILHIQSGGNVYAARKIAIDSGIEVRTDVNGDGETDRVQVTDNNLDGWDSVETILSVRLSNGEQEWITYPDRWDSYLVTGDLTGNGAADIVLVKIGWMSNHGTGEVRVLHVQTDESGKPEWVEYPGNFIQNPDLEPEWVGGWENYPYPEEDISIYAEPPVAMDGDYYGATIIEKDGKTMLRLIMLADAQTDSGMCIDCSYTSEGWYIEDILMVYDYYGGDWDEKLLGTW
ncbi:MAG: M56 family metallopeptidase [Candidatus Gastranaerophilales bacterium]|nr:M56 family metallopeptidase [Candidatus Gastranaerophilales bacterium]